MGKTHGMRMAEDKQAIRSSLKNWNINNNRPPTSTIGSSGTQGYRKRRVELAFKESVVVNNYTPVD